MSDISIPLFYPSDTPDFILGKNVVGGVGSLPVPIPDEIANEVAEFNDPAPVRNVEFWHSGVTTFYNYSNIALLEQIASGALTVKNSGGTPTFTLTSSGQFTVPSHGNIGGNANITGNANVTGNVTSPGVGTFTTQVISNLGTFSNLSAPYKLFDIPHPSKSNMRLRHGCLEGPELSVYARGKTTEEIIPLPEYWQDLVDADTITVHLTATSLDQYLIVESVQGLTISIGGVNNLPYHYYVMAERKDVPKLEIEIHA